MPLRVRAAAPSNAAAEAPGSETSLAETPSAKSGGPATVDEALAAGDLITARDLAREARQADPTPENWRREGEILERMGEYAAAEEAYRGELAALPPDADAERKRVRGDIQRIRDRARGRVEQEPPSTHRPDLDARWAPTEPPRKAAPKPAVEPEPVDARPERIVTKWYFWVTVAAIVASAAAVTGIAIKAARDDKGDALDLELGPMRPQGPAVLRF